MSKRWEVSGLKVFLDRMGGLSWWGTTASAAIQAKIEHYFGNQDLGVATFEPFASGATPPLVT